MHLLDALIAAVFGSLAGLAVVLGFRAAICGVEWLVRRWWRQDTTPDLWRTIWRDEGEHSDGTVA